MAATTPSPRPAAPAGAGPSVPDTERRRSGLRRRARDRLMDRATRAYVPNATLSGTSDLETLMLFIDDDLRETSLALARIEQYLVRTLGVLETRGITREHVCALASDPEVLDHLDVLNETLESLRRRLARLAARLR